MQQVMHFDSDPGATIERVWPNRVFKVGNRDRKVAVSSCFSARRLASIAFSKDRDTMMVDLLLFLSRPVL